MLDVEVATEVTAPAHARDALRARPDRVAAGHRRRRSSRCGSTRSARWRCRPRPRPAWRRRWPRSSAFGLGLDWMLEHPARLPQVTVEEVSAAAARVLRAGRVHLGRGRRRRRDRRPARGAGAGRAVSRPDGPPLSRVAVRPGARCTATDDAWLAEAWQRARVVADQPEVGHAGRRDGAAAFAVRAAGRPADAHAALPRRGRRRAVLRGDRRARRRRRLADAARVRRAGRRPRGRPGRQRGRARAVAPAAHALPAVRRADRRDAGRLDPDLHRRRQRALPAHRPGRDHAGPRRRRSRAARPRPAVGRRAGSRRWPGSSSRGSRSRRRWPARCSRRSASAITRRRATSPSQPWPFPASLMVGFVARPGRRPVDHPRPGRDGRGRRGSPATRSREAADWTDAEHAAGRPGRAAAGDPAALLDLALPHRPLADA